MPKVSKNGKVYGWVKQLPDFRDHVYTADVQAFATLPESMDLRTTGFLPEVWDQGELGSCAENSSGAAFAFDQAKQHQTLFMPGRLFVYYNVRDLEGTVSSDSGSTLRDVFKVLASQGVCREDLCPYNVANFTDKPSEAAYTDGDLHKVVSYKSVNQDLNSLKSVLAGGMPFVFGISVYESFESETVASTGMVPMPDPSEECLGGHALMAAGYDDSKSCFLVRNSWGTSWGIDGYFYLPYDYLTNPDLASDMWVITTVEVSG